MNIELIKKQLSDARELIYQGCTEDLAEDIQKDLLEMYNELKYIIEEIS